MDNNIFNNASKIEIDIYHSLKKVIDPELAINIIDLGLIYEIKYDEADGIKIVMTFSSKGCPMGDVIVNDIKKVLSEDFPTISHKIDITWEPVWNTGYVTSAGRKALGLTNE